MKTILIKGKQGVGKTTLATRLALSGDSIHVSQDGFKLDMLVKYKHVVIDECIDYEVLKEQLKYVSRVKGGSVICVSQNEEFNENGFDLVFRLK